MKLTTTYTLSAHEESGMLTDVPRTIDDPMKGFRLLWHRYLWVDMLCIVQDDEELRNAVIENVENIFTSAQLVIVAAWGQVATQGW